MNEVLCNIIFFLIPHLGHSLSFFIPVALEIEYDSVILKAMEKKAELINSPQWLIMKDGFVILGFVLRV